VVSKKLTEEEIGNVKHRASVSANAYSYGKGNSLKDIDPSGSLLFAFDGTENSNLVLRTSEKYGALHQLQTESEYVR
jgi:hypothetical protein